MKNSFKAGLIFLGISIIFLATTLFCQFYYITKGSGEYAVTLFPYTKYASYPAFATALSMIGGIIGILIGREEKELDLLESSVSLEDLKGEKKEPNKWRTVGYTLYIGGLAIFILGLIYSYLDATDFLSIPVMEGRGEMVFLNSIIPWIVAAIVLWAIATLPVTYSYKQKETELR